MNDDVVQDLKQFIAATVSQGLANVATKDDLTLLEKKLVNRMDTRFDEVMTAIADTMTQTNEDVDTRLEDHEERLIKLEHQVA